MHVNLEQKPLKSPETNVFAAGFSKLLESSRKKKALHAFLFFSMILEISRNRSQKPLVLVLFHGFSVFVYGILAVCGCHCSLEYSRLNSNNYWAPYRDLLGPYKNNRTWLGSGLNEYQREDSRNDRAQPIVSSIFELIRVQFSQPY